MLRLTASAVTAVATAALGLPLASAATTPASAGAAPPTAAPAIAAPAAAGPSGATVSDGCLTSVPDPGSTEPVEICYSLFRPAGATRDRRVPMILHSHGWGGSRTRDPESFRRWLDGGYGVLSFDQRGFGESGGRAHVENPDVEGHDVQRLLRHVAALRWVRRDGPGDPRVGAIGGSYGGGYQYLAAFTSLDRRGKPVLDALAPEITWWDLNGSLAPDGVVRTEWAYALSAAALPGDSLPPRVYKALLEGTATGTWPDGSVPGTEDMRAFFRKNGPRWHVAHGDRLDIPVLMGQGTTDTLFPLRQGLENWHRALTRSARARSIFVGYNGGHALPAVLPRGVQVTSDPCSERLGGGSFADLARKFMDEHLKGRDRGLRGYGRFHVATPAGRCRTVSSVAPTTSYRIGTVATTTAAGAPLAYEVADGPLRVVGSPHLTADLTALGVGNRAFYGLAVGTSPLDAKLVQNNVLPVNEPQPVVGVRRSVRLPAVAVDVPPGQKLYVVASAFSDTFAGMGSRTPGVITLEDAVVHLPVPGR